MQTLSFLTQEELIALEKEKTFYKTVISKPFHLKEYINLFDVRNTIFNKLLEHIKQNREVLRELTASIVMIYKSFEFKEVERTFNNKQLSTEVFTNINNQFINKEFLNLTNLGYDVISRVMNIEVNYKESNKDKKFKKIKISIDFMNHEDIIDYCPVIVTAI